MRTRTTAAVLVLIVVGLSRPSSAQSADGPVVPLSAVKGHTGFVRLVPVEHDPRTRLLADVARRIGLKSADAAAAAYDLSKQSLLVYVPKAAGDNGKFGLMAGLCFKPYDAPPAAWVDVLEQHHLIWVAAADCGDDAPAVRRIALLLDGVHAARQAWPVDPERVYLSMNTPTGPAVGAAFYYPEVFAGMIESPQAVWFATVKGFERPPQTWTTVTFARPQPSDLARARSHGRFFVVARDDGNVAADPAGKADPLAANAGLRRVVRHGYQATGFKHAQGLVVPASAMDHYSSYAADWFDQGVTFLDGPLLEKAQQRSRNTAAPTPARNASPSPVGPIRVPTGGQVPTPGGFGF